VSTVSRTDDIEVGCDPSFECRWWTIQRIGWGVMTLLLACGLAGVFGSGPLSKETIAPAGSHLQVRYERLARRETPTRLELLIQKPALLSGRVTVWLNRELLDNMQLQRIIPTPLMTEPLADGARFTFVVDPSMDATKVVFSQQPTTTGLYEGELAVEGAKPVRFRQFVYP
jgi:hypothetical protein